MNVAHECTWTYTQGKTGTVNPSSAGIFFPIDAIIVPFNLHHRKFVVMFKSGIPAQSLWLKITSRPFQTADYKLTIGAGSVLVNGFLGLPSLGTDDVDLPLSQSRSNGARAIGDWNMSFVGEPGEDSGAVGNLAPGFAFQTGINPNYELFKQRPWQFEMDTAAYGAILFYEDGAIFSQHQFAWFLGCESSNLPERTVDENHYETVI